MTTSFKKLLLISITLLFGVISDGVMAQTTNYDFTFSAGSGVSVIGSLGVDGSGVIQSISGVVSGTAYAGNITSLLAPGDYLPYPSVENMFSPSDPYLLGNGVAFSTNTGWFNLYLNDPTSPLPYTMWAGPAGADNNAAYDGTMTVGGAPEIDGSLAPKVGFLLGCLFLMFGRKKQNTESMLTA